MIRWYKKFLLALEIFFQKNFLDTKKNLLHQKIIFSVHFSLKNFKFKLAINCQQKFFFNFSA